MRLKLSPGAAAVISALAALTAGSALAQNAEPAATESIVVEGQYLNTTAASAMKLDIPLRDTPFSVSSYSDSFMKAIETAQVADLYKYMTGLQKAGGTGYDIVVRGFKTGVNDRNAIMVDGLPGLSSRFASPPTIGTERIEVVKGPASVLYGQAQPGGFVNVISKKPKAQFSGELYLKGTSFAGDSKPEFNAKTGYETAIDITGPIDKEKKFLYRFIADKTKDVNAWRDDAYAHTLYYAPSVTWNITPSTLLTLQHEWRKGQTNYDRGLVAPANRIDLIASRTTNYQRPTDYQNEDGRTYSMQFDHTFANDIKYGLTARRVETEDLANGFDNFQTVNVAAPAIPTVLQRRYNQIHNKRTSTYYDTNFVIPGKTWGIEHKLIVGVGGGFDTARLTRERFLSSSAYNVAINNPAPYVGDPGLLQGTTGVTNALQDRDNGTRSVGLYAADLMTLSEHWKLNLGFRKSDERQRMQALANPPGSTTITANGPVVTKVAKKTLPLAGLLYQPTEQWTFYTSYSTSFVPAAVTAQDVNGVNSFDPEQSTQYEVGSKADLMGGRLQPSLAIFQIKKRNLLSMFTCPAGIPATGTCSQQIGSQKVQGFELEINARPIDNLQVVAGISKIDGKVVESRDPVQTGAKLQNSANDSLHLWTRYDFSTGPLKGFGIGAGASYVGPRAGNLPVSPTASTPYSAVVMNLPGYTVADLGFYYTMANWDFSLRVSNLFDKTFVEATGATPEVQIQMGAPRQVALSGRYRF